MASPRDLPPWLRTILNLIAIIGVGATLMGWIQHTVGIIILVVAPLYVAWEICPWVVRNTRRYAALSLLIFVLVGGCLGATAWWAIRTFTKHPDLRPVQQNSSVSSPTVPNLVPTPAKNIANQSAPFSVDPIGSLSALGWTVKRDAGLLTFEVDNKALPSMEQSSNHFSQLREPFRLRLQSVPNLEGLEHLWGIGNCREIALSASDLSSISELAGFKALQKLDISQVPLNTHEHIDSAPLKGLVGLTSLVLNSRVSDLTPITRMPRLQRLIIEGALIRDLSPIRSLPLLKELDVRDSQVVDIAPASANTKLEELVIDTKQVSGLQALSSLPDLHKLTVIGQMPVDLSPIGNLTHLTSLFVWGSPSMNLGFLSRLPNLTNLQISGFCAPVGPRSQVTGTDGLCANEKLEVLTLGALEIPSLAFVRRCNTLIEINLRDIPISSLNELAAIQSLKKVSLVDVPITEISPLLALPNLARLSLIRVPARADVIAALERKGVKVENP